MKCSLQAKGFQNTIPYRVNVVHRLKNSRSTVSKQCSILYILSIADRLNWLQRSQNLFHDASYRITTEIYKVNRCSNIILQSSKHEADINIVETHEARLLNWISAIKRRIKEKKRIGREIERTRVGWLRFSMQILAVVTDHYRFNWFSLRSRVDRRINFSDSDGISAGKSRRITANEYR